MLEQQNANLSLLHQYTVRTQNSHQEHAAVGSTQEEEARKQIAQLLERLARVWWRLLRELQSLRVVLGGREVASDEVVVVEREHDEHVVQVL